MAETGWVKVYREIQEHWLYKEKRVFSKYEAWFDMLLMASYKDTKFQLGNEIINQARGEIITSELKLMEKWNWSKCKLRNFLSLLESDGMITKTSDRKKTAINIVNYSKYQDTPTTERPIEDRTTINVLQDDCKKTDHKKTVTNPVKSSVARDMQTTERPLTDRAETAERPQTEHNQEVKEVKKDKNNKNISGDLLSPNVNSNPSKKDLETFFETLWTLYPKKLGKGSVSETKKRALYKIGLEEITRSIERYKQEITAKGTDEQYIKNGSTFFNSGYVDYLDKNYIESAKTFGIQVDSS